MDYKNIHEAIAGVMGEVGYVKKERNARLDYTFTGEAALIAALRPAMVERGIYCHVLGVTEVQRENYTTKGGTAMVNTQLVATVRFTHAPSGTWIDAQATGEGSDAGDKSANKAMTGAYKYALRQTFCIETGDDPDRESHGEPGRAEDDGKGETEEPKQPRIAPTCHYCGCVMEERISKSKANPGRKFYACVNEPCQRQRDEDGNEHGMFRCWCDATDYKDKP
jgi:hypothetical protein